MTGVHSAWGMGAGEWVPFTSFYSRSTSLCSLHRIHKRFERIGVALQTEAANLPAADRRRQRTVTELLPCVHIGNMHFDGCDSRPCKGIPQSDTRMRKCAGIEDNAFEAALRPIVNLINQSALMVALEALDFTIAEIRGVIGKPALQVRKRRMPVNFG